MKKSGARQGHRIIDQEDIGREAENNKGNLEDEDMKELKDAHLVAATLIATVAFAAGFTMPGGYEGDKGPDQGFAVLTRNAAFKVFVIANSIAFSMGCSSVFMHIHLTRIKTKKSARGVRTFGLVMNYTVIVLVAMAVAFIAGTYAVLGHSSGLAIVGVCICVLLFFTDLVVYNKTLSKFFDIPLLDVRQPILI